MGIENTSTNVVRSGDIWTDDFDNFEKLISSFPAKGSISEVKICVIDIEGFSEENEETDPFNFESIEIVQIKFVDSTHLAVLAKVGYEGMGRRSTTCLFTIDFEKSELDFQDNLRLNDYEMGLNELAFDFGMIANQISINETKKYLFSSDVDAQSLSVCGKRKLAAISCDPSAENKCNRLIVLDINCDEQETDDEDDETESDDSNNDKQEMSTSNEDSYLKNIVDID